MRKVTILLLMLSASLRGFSQQGPIGIFDGQLDVGKDTKPGSGIYIPQTQQYVISGALRQPTYARTHSAKYSSHALAA